MLTHVPRKPVPQRPARRRSRWLRRVVTCICAVTLAASAAPAQDNQNEKRGFDAESLYSVGEIDTVNLFNAGLSMVIPIGGRYPLSAGTSRGLQLVYNGKLWDYRTVLVAPPATFHRIAIPTRVTNTGLGWTLNPGYFLEKNGTSEVPHEWNHSQYVGPDGSQHYFYDQLHLGEDDGDPDVWYTQDNTYLRLTKVNPSLYRIELPNGEIHEFGYQLFDTSTQWRKWFLTSIVDRHGNWMSITYDARGGTWSWVIADQHGRSHTVTLTYFSDIDDYYVTSVDLGAFGGARAIYTFTYEAASIEQGCGATFPMNGVDVRFLTSLTLPSGEAYDMTEGGAHRYWTFCGGGARESGAIKGMRLPTRGQIEWDYAEFQLPHYFEHGSNAAPATSEVRGVRQRRTLDEGGNVLGIWSYRRELVPPPPYNPGDPRGREQRVHVEDPLGHCTTHYFDANPGYTEPVEDSNPFPGWSYSLPFSWEEPRSGGHHLSTQVYDGTDEFGHCSGTLLRTGYVSYEHDVIPSPISTPAGPIFEPLHDSNRRVRSRRTVYPDDGDTFAETTSGDFDGLGHYRDSATGGNFDAGNARQQTTDFNTGLGSYVVDQATNTSTGDFTPPLTTAPWILATFDRRTVTAGSETAVVTTCFDASGFLTRRRSLVGASESEVDLIAVFEPDAAGNVAAERHYGGDLQSVATGPDLCALALPEAPEYEIEHQYAFGARKLSRYLDGGNPMPFNHLDLDIDPSTGMVAASRDTTGIETTFLYDIMGRVTDERPEAGHSGWVKTIYVNATPSANARVEVERQPNGGGPSLVKAQVVYDGLGRIFQEKSELPSEGRAGGVRGEPFGVRETLYNARGDRSSVSEAGLGSPSPKRTDFLEYDPFGRPGRIRPPDGSAHDVTITYAGVRQVSRTSQVATGSDGAETASTLTEIYDRQGRLYRVAEPGTGTTTTYGYDVGSRLSSVAMGGQTRLFDFDNLGFLRSETHPELGTSGNGAVTYSNYDARGNLGRMADDRRTLDSTYDAAERLLTVTSPADGPIKQFIYDTAPTRGLGKVHQAIRHNVLDVPGDGTSSDVDVVVTETYDYAGIDAQVSSVLTTNSFNDLDFLVSQTYEALGRVEDLTYPICQGSAECPSNPLVVRGTYQADYLVAVGVPGAPTAGAAIAYHPSGLWSTLVHGNGVTTTQTADPNGMRRPGRISVSGVSQGTPFDTGTYQYDGSGNIWAMGGDRFEYDLLERLTDSDAHGWQRDFVYDAFGNITRVDTIPPDGPFTSRDVPVSATTNRLTSHGYDGSGNLTDFGGVWTQVYDPVNLAILRDPMPDASQWAAIYTAGDERLATWDFSSGEVVQHWTLRSPSGQILRDFRYGRPAFAEPVFCDGFESGDTSAWSSATGLRDPSLPPAKNGLPSEPGRGSPCPAPPAPEWTVDTSYAYRDGALLADIQAGIVRFYHLDHLGSVRQITGPTAAIAASYNYLPYGKEVDSNIAALQFTGQERDSHLPGDTDDLDYMHARYYSPFFGRFTSVDPVNSADPSLPQSFNKYAYALSSPINYTDPTGNIAFLAVVGAAWAVAEVVGSVADAVEVTQVWLDNNASLGAKLGTTGLAAIGLIAPGGGYSKIDDAVELADDVVDAVKKVPNPHGRLGKQSTREHVAEVATEMKSRGFEVTGGGGKHSEEYIASATGGRKGSAFPDITAEKSGRTLRVNTVDTLKDGITPNARERKNAARIRGLRPKDHLLLIPKPKG